LAGNGDRAFALPTGVRRHVEPHDAGAVTGSARRDGDPRLARACRPAATIDRHHPDLGSSARGVHLKARRRELEAALDTRLRDLEAGSFDGHDTAASGRRRVGRDGKADRGFTLPGGSIDGNPRRIRGNAPGAIPLGGDADRSRAPGSGKRGG
jgi:hypothetical protein